MRKIRLVNANLGQAKTVETEATTWGELKTEVSDMHQGNVKAVIKQTQVSLESDIATLPEGDLAPDEEYDFTLFFVTKESKAGSNYDSWDFQALRREVAARGMNNNRKNRSRLIADLRRTDNASGSPTAPFDVKEILERIEGKLDFIVDALEEAYQEEEDDNRITEEEMEAFRSIQNMI